MPDLPEKHEKLGPTNKPTEQGTPDGGRPFEGGGRRADLPYDYDQRASADADYFGNIRNADRKDRAAVGQMHGKDDGTPWVGRGPGHPKGRNAGD